jgi:hypothetical protein
MKKTSAKPSKQYNIRYTKAELEELFGKTVIIKLNTYYSYRYADNSQYIYHPRFGHVGVVTMIIDEKFVQVKFEDGAYCTFPIIQVFFLRYPDEIFTEAMSCREFIIKKHGKREYKTICSILQYSSDGNVKKALQVAYSTIYVYHFITYLGCSPEFPEHINEQENDKQRFLNQRKQLFMPDMEEKQILKDIHDIFLNAPILFRKLVCLDCGYSIPTFYRKMRQEDKYMTPALNNAEKESILKQGDLVLKGIIQCLNKYRKPKK